MTKEYIISVDTSKKETTMSTLDKIIILWFIAKAINLMVLLIKRTIKK